MAVASEKFFVFPIPTAAECGSLVSIEIFRDISRRVVWRRGKVMMFSERERAPESKEVDVRREKCS